MVRITKCKFEKAAFHSTLSSVASFHNQKKSPPAVRRALLVGWGESEWMRGMGVAIFISSVVSPMLEDHAGEETLLEWSRWEEAAPPSNTFHSTTQQPSSDPLAISASSLRKQQSILKSDKIRLL